MNEDEMIIESGPFKGKKITFAPTNGVAMFLEISEDFMGQIFDFEPGEYLISDESSLSDFTGLDEIGLVDVHKKIQAVYDVDVSDIQSGNLLEIFTRLHHHQYGKPL